MRILYSMKTTILLFLLSISPLLAGPNEDVAASTQRAIDMFPDCDKEGTPLFNAVVARIEEMKKKDGASFDDTMWPVKIASEEAAKLGINPAGQKPAGPGQEKTSPPNIKAFAESCGRSKALAVLYQRQGTKMGEQLQAGEITAQVFDSTLGTMENSAEQERQIRAHILTQYPDMAEQLKSFGFATEVSDALAIIEWIKNAPDRERERIADEKMKAESRPAAPVPATAEPKEDLYAVVENRVTGRIFKEDGGYKDIHLQPGEIRLVLGETESDFVLSTGDVTPPVHVPKPSVSVGNLVEIRDISTAIQQAMREAKIAKQERDEDIARENRINANINALAARQREIQSQQDAMEWNQRHPR